MREWIWISALVWTVVCLAVNAYTWRVAYPLWRSVEEASFAAVHREYLRRLDLVITAPHVLMFFSAAALLLRRPAWFGPGPAVLVFVAETAVILVSLLVAGPVHSRFTQEGRIDDAGMRRLIRVSAVRTLLMCCATAILIAALRRQL